MSKKINPPTIEKPTENIPATFKPYDQSNPISKMKFFVTIVNHRYDKEILAILYKHEVALSFITHGRGTGTKEIYDILGLSDIRKDIVFAVVKSERVESLKKEIAAFYEHEKGAKGIAFGVDISAVIGLSIYKYLSNTRQ
jgi:hypothetical protein